MKSILTVMYLFIIKFSFIESKCSTISLQTNPPINVTEYIKSSWYIQEQQINGYQKEEDLNCVVATYNIDNKSKVPFFKGKVFSVYNYANKYSVNGNATNNSTVLCGRIPNTNHSEKILVAPCFLPNIFGGPYWIVLAGPYQNDYKWAVVSGGQPTVQVTNSTCTTKTTGVNGSGLWIFSRTKVLDQDTLKMIKQKMINKGIAISKLLQVQQKGCKYQGVILK
jgi:lipocalin